MDPGPDSETELRVDRFAGPVIGIGPQMGDRVEGLGHAGVAEPGLHRLHRVPMPDQEAGVEVPKVVKARPRAKTGTGYRRAPDTFGERVAT